MQLAAPATARSCQPPGVQQRPAADRPIISARGMRRSSTGGPRSSSQARGRLCRGPPTSISQLPTISPARSSRQRSPRPWRPSQLHRTKCARRQPFPATLTSPFSFCRPASGLRCRPPPRHRPCAGATHPCSPAPPRPSISARTRGGGHLTPATREASLPACCGRIRQAREASPPLSRWAELAAGGTSRCTGGTAGPVGWAAGCVQRAAPATPVKAGGHVGCRRVQIP